MINEFSANTVGTDVEYVELLAEPGTDLSGYRVLEIEGDARHARARPRRRGHLVRRTRRRRPRRSARCPRTRSRTARCRSCSCAAFTGALGNDLDANDDGVLDASRRHGRRRGRRQRRRHRRPRLRRHRRSASPTTASPSRPGGASRIPDGTDTDSPADWVRNDFDKAGIPGNTGTLVAGEAAEHARVRRTRSTVDRGRRRADADCDARRRDDRLGAGLRVPRRPRVGTTVELEGVVVGDFQTGGFNGYYLQDAGDGDAATSDGIFVYAPGGVDVAVGDEVHVVGTVSEFFGMTEITGDGVAVCAHRRGAARRRRRHPPGRPAALRAARGHARDPAAGRSRSSSTSSSAASARSRSAPSASMQPTAVVRRRARPRRSHSPRRTPRTDHARRRPQRGEPRPGDPPERRAVHARQHRSAAATSWRTPPACSTTASTRWGDAAHQGADYTAVNPAPTPVPEVGGTTTVSSFNVLNYFTTLGSRAARTTRRSSTGRRRRSSRRSPQIDADIFGLIEIENNGDTAVGALVDALNERIGAGTYDFISTGRARHRRDHDGAHLQARRGGARR